MIRVEPLTGLGIKIFSHVAELFDTACKHFLGVVCQRLGLTGEAIMQQRVEHEPVQWYPDRPLPVRIREPAAIP